MEVVRSRLAVSSPGVYSGLWDAVQKTFKKEGVRSFYRGMTPAILGIIPYAAIDLGVFDFLKTLYTTNEKRDPTVFTLLACGAISSTLGQTGNQVGVLLNLSFLSFGFSPETIASPGNTRTRSNHLQRNDRRVGIDSEARGILCIVQRDDTQSSQSRSSCFHHLFGL